MKKQLIITLTVLILVITLTGAVSATEDPDSVKYVSPTGNDDNDGTETNPYLTIGKGITSVSADGTVNVADGTYYEHLVIDKNLNLVGQSQENTILDGSNTGRPLTINTGATVNISLFTIKNGMTRYGAGIFNDGTLTLNQCKLQDNIANGVYADGGAIYNRGSIIIQNSLIKNNQVNITSIYSSFGRGGAMYNSGVATISDSTISFNKADEAGGIFNYAGSTLEITGSTISGNTALKGHGGGVYNHYSMITIFNTTISGNSAQVAGGGICNTGDTTVTESIITDNTAQVGGGISNGDFITVIDSVISDNTAISNGGGIYNGGIVTMSGSTISGNTASYDGGAINSQGTVNVSDCTFHDNKAIDHNGGAIYTAGTLNVSDSIFTNNIALTSGGAIDNNYGTTTVIRSIFNYNEAFYGGAINNYHGTVLATSSRFEYNQAVNGGAISHSGSCTLNYNTFVGNTAITLGHAINNYSGSINAHYNWWGSNNPDFATLISGVVDYNPWLYMSFQADPTTIAQGETSTLTASFNNAFDGTTVTPLDPVNGHIPDGILVTFKTDLGEVGSQEVDKPTTDGVATATLNGTESGLATVNAALDDEELSDTVEIEAIEYNLTVNVTGQGTATKNPDMASYPMGTVVTLTAVADPGWSFSHWTGDLTGNTNPQTMTMDGDKSVTAVFVEDVPEYNLTTGVTGQGSITKNPDMASYPMGTVVTLTAVADPGWSFSHWTGDLTGNTNPQTMTMDGDKSVTVVFVEDAPETGIFTRLMVQDAARRVRNFINSRGVLPNWVRMEDTAGITHYVTMPVFLELSTASLISSAHEFKAMDVQTAPRPTGPAIVNRNLYKYGYLNMAVRVNNFIRNNGVAPNFASSSLGNIRYQALVDSFARIVAFQFERGVLPNYVVINTRRVR